MDEEELEEIEEAQGEVEGQPSKVKSGEFDDDIGAYSI